MPSRSAIVAMPYSDHTPSPGGRRWLRGVFRQCHVETREPSADIVKDGARALAAVRRLAAQRKRDEDHRHDDPRDRQNVTEWHPGARSQQPPVVDVREQEDEEAVHELEPLDREDAVRRQDDERENRARPPTLRGVVARPDDREVAGEQDVTGKRGGERASLEAGCRRLRGRLERRLPEPEALAAKDAAESAGCLEQRQQAVDLEDRPTHEGDETDLEPPVESRLVVERIRGLPLAAGGHDRDHEAAAQEAERGDEDHLPRLGDERQIPPRASRRDHQDYAPHSHIGDRGSERERAVAPRDDDRGDREQEEELD